MARPDEALELLRPSTEHLIETARGCDEGAMRQPTMLPSWSVAQVLTHLARNADSHVRRLLAATEGRIVPQYEGGREARDAAIDAGAQRPRDEIVADLETACATLDEVLGSLPRGLWEHVVVQREQFKAPASTLPFTRLLEVEVHHVDLRRGYGPEDWPDDFTRRALPQVMERLAERGSEVGGSEVSWHLHRTDGAGEWVVRRESDTTKVSPEHAKADCAIRGPGSALLVWLLGRMSSTEAGLELLGDADLAASLPLLYPYG